MKRRNSHSPAAIPAIFASAEDKNSSNSMNSSKTSFYELGCKAPAQTRSLTNEEWLDSVGAAAYLKITLGALRNMTSNGQIRYYKMGRRNRYRIEELRELLLSNARGVRNGY